MFKHAIMSLSLVLSSPAVVRAASCEAIGYFGTNSVPGVSVPTITSWQKIVIRRDGADIGQYDVCDKCSSVCADSINIPVDGLPATVGWGATCAVNIFTECHGSYNTISHIDGEPPQNGNDFYGLGIATTSQCRFTFDC